MVRRILVLGSSGSGKTTVAERLAAKLELEAIHLDSYFWKPDWMPTEPSEWESIVRRLLQRPGWVMDGNYRNTLDLRLKAADTVLFLDLGRIRCLWRCLSRLWKNRGNNRAELATGCNEKMDWEFFQWIWNYPRRVKPGVLERFDRAVESKQLRVFILRSPKEIEDFLATCGPRGCGR